MVFLLLSDHPYCHYFYYCDRPEPKGEVGADVAMTMIFSLAAPKKLEVVKRAVADDEEDKDDVRACS